MYCPKLLTDIRLVRNRHLVLSRQTKLQDKMEQLKKTEPFVNVTGGDSIERGECKEFRWVMK